MYHRFEENKYPSTNIKLKDFKEHLKIIREKNISFINPNNFEQDLKNNKNQRKILLTIDDGFSSFYENAWPYLKENKIPTPIAFIGSHVQALPIETLKKEKNIDIVFTNEGVYALRNFFCFQCFCR